MKSKVQNAFFALILISAIAVSVSSCSSKKQNRAPVITVEEPDDNAMIALTDSIHIEGTVTDDEGLHEMSVLILKSTGDTAAREYPYVHDLKTYPFHYHFHPSATGTYTLQITAEDHDEKSSIVSRSFMVM
jgi:hypothetical protein